VCHQETLSSEQASTNSVIARRKWPTSRAG
jgi:hypothetical protein